MSNLTAQQIYERTRGKDSPENVEKRNLKALGHKSHAKDKALERMKISGRQKIAESREKYNYAGQPLKPKVHEVLATKEGRQYSKEHFKKFGNK